jgi:hypothetical protein
MKKRLAYIGDFLLFWCIIFPIAYVLFLWMFRNSGEKVKYSKIISKTKIKQSLE